MGPYLQQGKQMDPIVADIQPQAVSLEKDKKYFWCACGKSKSQPFCDGSHRGSGFSPRAFTAEKEGDAYLCNCKQTKNPPFCDGTHRSFKSEQIGRPLPLVKTTNENVQPEGEATPEEPYVARIHEMAKNGLSKTGHHGEMVSMGVPRQHLPSWDNLQLLVAQFATKPLMEDTPVATKLIIGPRAKKPLELKIPLFVSDMSFGALSEEAKIALAKGAQLAGTGICSGEGGMLPEEQAANERYFYELASAQFGYQEELLKKVQAFHFKGGQGAKTGTGGHLPGVKVTPKIAAVRHLSPGQDAISPPTFVHLSSVKDFRDFAERVREISGGIPIGFKLSAQHIEKDIDFALEAAADYIILDGRGGGTGAAPALFRNNISVPTIPALARARRHLDKTVGRDVTLIATGGLRVPEDFVKALALGADGVAISNSAMQAIGCVGARMCNTNNCPAGIATQDPHLRKRMNVDTGAERLARFFQTSVSLMQVLARACGHSSLNQFRSDDLTTFDPNMARLTGVSFGGVEL